MISLVLSPWYVLRCSSTMFRHWTITMFVLFPTKCTCYLYMRTPELLICRCQPQSVHHWCFIVASDTFHHDGYCTSIFDHAMHSSMMSCTDSIIDVQMPGQLWTSRICLSALPAITAAWVITRYVASRLAPTPTRPDKHYTRVLLALLTLTTCDPFPIKPSRETQMG